MIRRQIGFATAIVCLLFLIGQVLAEGETKDALIGTWDGNVNTYNGPLHVVVHLKQTSDGSYQSILDRPDRKEFGSKADVTVVQDRKLHFEVKKIGVIFDGAINHKGYLVGIWKQDGASIPLILERVSILDK